MENVFNRVVLVSGMVTDAKRRKELGKFLGIDVRTDFTDKDITRLSRNTNELMLNGNRRPPIKFGHGDSNQERKGEFLNTYVKRIEISGKMRNGLVVPYKVNDKFANDVENLYPDQSIEFEDDGDSNDENGNPLPLHLTGLALLGTDTGAMANLPKGSKAFRNFSIKELNKIEAKMKKDKKPGMIKKMFGKVPKELAEIPDDLLEESLNKVMLIQELAGKLESGPEVDEIKGHAEWLQDQFESAMGETEVTEEEETQEPEEAEPEMKTEDPPADEKSEGKEDELKKDEEEETDMAVKKELSALEKRIDQKFDKLLDVMTKSDQKELDNQRVKAFDKLVANGHLHKDDTKLFNSMAKDGPGLEQAQKFFGKYRVETPSTQEITGGGNHTVIDFNNQTDLEKFCVTRCKDLFPQLETDSKEFKKQVENMVSKSHELKKVQEMNRELFPGVK